MLSNKKILLVAVLLSCITSGAYACMWLGPSWSYSFCSQIALLGFPGILIAVVLLGILLGTAHGGGPLAAMLAISTPINFLFYGGMGVAARAVWKVLKRRGNKST